MSRVLTGLLVLGVILGLLGQTTGSCSDQSNKTVAASFLVRLSSSTLPSTRSVMQFEEVIQNLGNAYSPTTGKFTAPVSGTYLFHVSAGSYAQIQVDLVMDGDVLATAWGYHGSLAVQGSNMAVVHMREGQRVWAEFVRGGTVFVARGYTQFTGTWLRSY